MTVTCLPSARSATMAPAPRSLPWSSPRSQGEEERGVHWGSICAPWEEKELILSQSFNASPLVSAGTRQEAAGRQLSSSDRCWLPLPRGRASHLGLCQVSPQRPAPHLCRVKEERCVKDGVPLLNYFGPMMAMLGTVSPTAPRPAPEAEPEFTSKQGPSQWSRRKLLEKVPPG